MLIIPTPVANRVVRRNYHTVKLRMFNNRIATLERTETRTHWDMKETSIHHCSSKLQKY